MRRQQPERTIQRDIAHLLTTVGGRVYTIGTVRRRGDHPGTMQSPGLPDLLVFLPVSPQATRLLLIECKAPGGRLSDAQQQFRDRCTDARLDYVCGGLDDVLDWLAAHGYVRRKVAS